MGKDEKKQHRQKAKLAAQKSIEELYEHIVDNLEAYLVCSDCGASLDVSYHNDSIEVEPCMSCIDKYLEEGLKEFRRE